MTDHKRVDRGRRAQRYVADALREAGVVNAEPQAASLPGTDVLGWPGADVEVKATETASPATWVKQVARRAEAGVLGLVFYQPRGMGPANMDDWPVTLRWGDLRPMLVLAGHLPAQQPAGPFPVDVPPSNTTPPSVAEISPPPS